MIPRGITLSKYPISSALLGQFFSQKRFGECNPLPLCSFHFHQLLLSLPYCSGSKDRPQVLLMIASTSLKKSAKFTFPWNITFAAFHKAMRKESIMYKIWLPEILKILRIIPTWLMDVPQSIEWQYLPFPQSNPISLSLYLFAHRRRWKDLKVRTFSETSPN